MVKFNKRAYVDIDFKSELKGVREGYIFIPDIEALSIKVKNSA